MKHLAHILLPSVVNTAGLGKENNLKSTKELGIELIVTNSWIPSHWIILIESSFPISLRLFIMEDSKFCPIHSHVLGHSIV